MDARLEQLRHSAAHLLAQALEELFPGTLFGTGPATEEGFFYDIVAPRSLKEEDLPVIEQRMQDIAERNLPITHRHISRDEAEKIFGHNPFKRDIMAQITDETVGLAQQGEFKDLCRGGHVKSTGDIRHFKLTNISGSYWRGKKENAQMQRISGVAFLTAKELADYIAKREDALKYDHRRLGKEMDLFSFHEEGPGFPFFHPKGQTVINVLKEYMRSLTRLNNYQEIQTPTMLSASLWERSGHYAHYKENMYFSTIDERLFAIKPMNCPGAFLVYKTRPRSYRELPLRLSEFGHVHRHELSGVLHGLMRVRAFTQDDAHIMCMPEQIQDEIVRILRLTHQVLKRCGFDRVRIAIATKPEKAMGSEALWDQATQALMNALNAEGLEYTIKHGEGAFYGPKIEIGMEDSLGRYWQCGTIQVDFFQPENFDMTYVASSGKKERPVILHQAMYGSLERFFAIILEHHKGHLPLWLAPVQARVVTVTDAQNDYAHAVYKELMDAGVRAELDESADPLSGKIKTAQLERVPLMLVIGNKEVEQSSVTMRHRDGKQEFGKSVADVITLIKNS